MPHHDDAVEVFVEGEHLGTAQLVDRLSRSETARLLEQRARDARWLAKVTRAAETKRRIVYAAMTEAGPPRPVTAITAGASSVERAARGDEGQRQLASRSLAPPVEVPVRMARPARTRS